jgi:hypothetical protein
LIDSQITQEGCDTPGDTDACKQVRLSTVKAGDYRLKFIIKAKGGALFETEEMVLSVCGLTYNKSLKKDFQFDKTPSGTKAYSVATIDSTKILTSDPEKCAIEKYIFKETS